VTAIRELSRLESAEYHLERVMDVKDHQSRAFGLVEAEDSLLLVVAGDVVAGVDLAGIGEEDVQVDRQNNSVRVTLPAPKILSARLDNETYVHSRSTDLLAKHNTRLEARRVRAPRRSCLRPRERRASSTRPRAGRVAPSRTSCAPRLPYGGSQREERVRVIQSPLDHARVRRRQHRLPGPRGVFEEVQQVFQRLQVVGFGDQKRSASIAAPSQPRPARRGFRP
jgi:hypothetical protein